MHKLAEKIADCLKAKVEGMGIDNINGQNLVEFELWSKIAKNLVCYDKDKRIIEAMDEAEEVEEAMKYIEMYEHYPEDDRKGYRGQPRDSRGRYMSRRGYESRIMPEMHWDDMEYERDMDRPYGRMGYSGSGSSGGSLSGMSSGGSSSSGMSGGSMGSQGGSRGYSESRYDRARRGYEEAKMTKDSSPEGKKKTMEGLESYLKRISEDVADFAEEMDANEKSMVRSKLQVLAQKFQ